MTPKPAVTRETASIISVNVHIKYPSYIFSPQVTGVTMDQVSAMQQVISFLGGS